MTSTPLLHFDFADKDGRKRPLLFRDPVKVIVAESIDEIIPSLNAIEEETKRGRYAAGYISYESSPAFNPAFRVHTHSRMPLLWFGIYEEPTKEELTSAGYFKTSAWTTKTTEEKYRDSIGKIYEQIENGNTYQVNYTIRLEAGFEGDTIAYYTKLREAQTANYSAYLDIGGHTIISASPELFFRLHNGKVSTRPMKGTVGRGKTAEEDEENAAWLLQSEKNRAENVMIVDLLRNDLGMIAEPATVEVPELFTIEKYPTVYQMTSAVTAEISPDKKLADLFRALFPCGSITGAPKVSTMKIIEELEEEPREVYCGAIGYITPDQDAVFNVPIRTVMIDHATDTATYGAGGGITWDSTEKEEYEEVLTKTRVLNVQPDSFRLLESLGLEDGSYFVLENHLARLKQAAGYFNFNISISKISKKLAQFARNHPSGNWKVRLLVGRDGEFTIEGVEIENSTSPFTAALADKPIEKTDPFLLHKTTNRKTYLDMLHRHPGYDEVLLWNGEGEITEFTTGNIVVEMDGILYTPPVRSGLLAGTFREKLIEEKQIKERVIMLDDMNEVSGIWLINSVRKWVPVILQH